MDVADKGALSFLGLGGEPQILYLPEVQRSADGLVCGYQHADIGRVGRRQGREQECACDGGDEGLLTCRFHLDSPLGR